MNFSLPDLPKIDLHLHLDGALRTPTIIELARVRNVELPTYDTEELEEHVTVSPDCSDLSEFLRSFEVFYPVLRHPESVRRVSRELCQGLIKQGIPYAEVRFAPGLLTTEEYDQEDIVESVIEGMKDYQDQVITNLILCLYRDLPEEENKKTVQLANEYSTKNVVGVDVAGDEQSSDLGQLEDLFQRISDNLNLTIHAGETGSVDNVRRALEFGTDRIGHGISLIQSQDLMRRVRDENVPVEICLTSNLLTGAVEGLEHHPLRDFFDYGIPITINTDDPSVCGTTLLEEYRKLVSMFDISAQELIRLSYQSVEASFADKSTRDELRNLIDQFRERTNLEN